MLISIAWKNVWRNKLRSLIVVSAIVIGLLGGLFYLAFSNGMIQEQIRATINHQISNIQIHNPKYLINDEIDYTIDLPQNKIDAIKKLSGIKAVCMRIKSPAMASSATTGTGITLNGINIANENSVTNLKSLLKQGNYFATEMRKPAVIGSKLAEKLKVKINSKFVITIQDVHGNITYGAFRVVGIYKTENSKYDLQNVFVKKSDLQKLIDFPSNKTTEIAILLTNNDSTEVVAKRIMKLFPTDIAKEKIVVQTWSELMPALKLMNDMTIQFTFIFVIIILIALSFGIINTMMMAIMERTRELGMLMSIGMSKLRIFLMIMSETIFLSITGGAIGLLFSWIAIAFANSYGIDLSNVAQGLNALGYSSIVHPVLELKYYILIALLVIVTAILSSIFPARKALKLNPAEAVRTDV